MPKRKKWDYKGFTDVQNVSLTNEQYHSMDPLTTVSNTGLKIFSYDPQDYYQLYITGEMKRERKAHFEFGIVFHEVVLEPHATLTQHNCLDKTCAVFRECNKPDRDPDMENDFEKIWFVTRPEPGVVRQSKMWGHLKMVSHGGVGAHTTRHWHHVNDEGWCDTEVIGRCAYEDMILDGHSFTAIPADYLSKSGG